MPFITVNNHTLHYTDTPPSTLTGPKATTLIFIHGLGSTQNYFQPILPYLTCYRCITFDTYGAGRSHLNSPPGEHSIATIAIDVLSILDLLLGPNPDPAIIIGYSMGGMVPTHLAATAPSRVRATILLGPVHPTPAVAEVFRKRIPAVQQQGMDAMADTIPSGATGRDASPLVRAFIREMLLAQSVDGYVVNCRAIEEAVAPDYASVECPVLIIAGEEDKSAPVAGCEFILGHLGSKGERDEEDAKGKGKGKKKLVVLDGVGHWMAVEKPEKVGELVREFCDEVVG